MKNVTISMDEALLDKAKKRAAELGISLNALIKQLVKRELGHDDDWMEEWFRHADAINLKIGTPLTREEIYDR